jgi:uncharacterized protein YfkK (UPF0435 family)
MKRNQEYCEGMIQEIKSKYHFVGNRVLNIKKMSLFTLGSFRTITS